MLPTGTCQKGHFNLIFWSGKKNRHLSHFRCVTRNIGHAKHRSFALPTCTCEMSHFDLTFWSAKINCRQSHFRHITQNVTVIHCSQVPASEMTLAEFFGRGKKIVTSHIFSVSHERRSYKLLTGVRDRSHFDLIFWSRKKNRHQSTFSSRHAKHITHMYL